MIASSLAGNIVVKKYLAELQHIESFADALLHEMNKVDVIETPSGKKSLHRIYRDVRFSKDKKPYKTHWSGSFKREGKSRRGTYYFHIEPGKCFMAGGKYNPSPDQLRAIRNKILNKTKEFEKIIKNKDLVTAFGKLWDEGNLKTIPRGFAKDHPSSEYLKYKNFFVMHNVKDEKVLSKNTLNYSVKILKLIKPLNDFMSDI